MLETALLSGVIYLYPISIRVFEIDLVDTVYPFGDGILFPGKVLILDLMLAEIFDEFIYGRNSEAKMVLLFMRYGGSCTLYYMQMAFGSDAEPGMFAIMEWFRDRIETDYILIEMRAFFQVNYIKCNMIKSCAGFIILRE